MATQLQIVNRVLRRLREDPVTSVADSEYAQVLGEFVNDILREAQDVHQWTACRDEVSTATVASTSEYDLSASINDNSDLLWVMLDDSGMKRIPFDEARQLQLQNPSAATGEPFAFGIENMTMRLYPIPDDVYTVTSKWYVPQYDLEVDGTDDNTEIKIPERPVYLGALVLALNERGEELGEPGGIAERRYNNALGDAILRDEQERIATNYYDGYRD